MNDTRNTDVEPPEQSLRHCADCGDRREHDPSILIREHTRMKGVQSGNNVHSRQSYRVYTCVSCEEETLAKFG